MPSGLLTMQTSTSNQRIYGIGATGDCSLTDDPMAALPALVEMGSGGTLDRALASELNGILEGTLNLGMLISKQNSGELTQAAVVKGHPGKCLKVTGEDGSVSDDEVDNPDSNENDPGEEDDIGEGEHEEVQEEDDDANEEEEGEEEEDSDSDDERDYDEGDDDSEDTSDSDIDDEEEGCEEEEEVDLESLLQLAQETTSSATATEKGTAAGDDGEEKVGASHNEVGSGSPPRKKKK